MLEKAAVIFEEKDELISGIRKKNYELRMKQFYEKYQSVWEEMTEYVDNVQEKDAAAKEVAEAFIASVREKFQVRGKIKGYIQTDLNMFMTCYVFPAILMTEKESAGTIAEAIQEKWRTSFKSSEVTSTPYEDIHSSFRRPILERLFGRKE